MRRLPISIFLILGILLVTAAVPTWAQRTSGSIRGTVTDPDGAPAAGIKVSVINVDTGFSRETETNNSGAYSFPELPVGTYLLTAEGEGYREYLVQNIQLNVADVREQDIQMALGEFTDQVTVTSSSIVVETIGGEVAGLITGEQVRELPLNGRNVLQLTQLMPGVAVLDDFNSKDKGLFTGSDMSVSGGRTTGNQWSVDGANNNDVGSNRTVLIYPSIDAIEEFKIHRNAYGAEFGGAGGAQVNMVTRGGTNNLQGSVFYFMRDDSLNAANFILRQAGQPKEPISRDDYGFTLGGALKKDKVHFFVSTEVNDEIRGTVVSAFVPTAAEKQGDFSQSNPDCSPIPTDLTTGLPFPGNVIPADRLSQAGLLYLQLMPPANATLAGTCTNWVEALPVPQEWDQINARADWNITANTRFMIRYTEDSWLNASPTAGDANGLWGDDPFPVVDSSWDQPSYSRVAQLNQVIGSTAINTVTYSESGNEIIIGNTGDVDLLQRINAAMPPVFPDKVADPRGHPVFWGGQGGLPTLWNSGPWNNFQDLKVFKDDFEKVFGNHVVKAGLLYGDSRKLEILDVSSAENTTYWGSAGIEANPWGGGTGSIIADFLLDDMLFGFSEKSSSGIGDQTWEDLEIYVADSWRVAPNVTLDVGVRYSQFDWPVDEAQQSLNFDPATFDPALGGDSCNGLLWIPGTDPCREAGLAGGAVGPNSALIPNDDDNFAPRLGLAWDVFGTGKSVFRAGFGQFYQREALGWSLALVNNPPELSFTGGIRTLDGDVEYLDYLNPGRPQRGYSQDAQTPYNLQYNLTWEQQVGDSSTIEVSYVGSRGRHLTRSNDINQVAPGDIDGNGVEDRLDYARCPGGDGGNSCRAVFRPYGPAFGSGDIGYWTTDGASEYDSLQTQYTLRFGRGSQLQASYTFADFDANTGMNDSSTSFNADATTMDLSNPGLDWAPAILHRDHTLNASMIYNLPSFEGVGGFKEHVLGNWSVGGIAIWATGTPITILSADPGGELNGTHPGSIGYEGHARPLLTGEPCGASGSSLQVLNPDAFTLTGYRLGDPAQQSRRGQCEGPDFLQVDLSAYKQIPFGDRFNLQLRLEVFNVFNKTNVVGQSVDRNFNPGVALDAPRASATSVVSTGEPAGTFGQATAVRDPRQVQLGIKLSF
jgi:hypothetical protein